jgi:anti-sigma factor (TIGR02949 family)
MTCDRWPEQITAYVDGELDPSQQAAFRAHAQECSHCAAQALAITESKAAIRGAASRYAAPLGLRERVLGVASEESAGSRVRRQERAIKSSRQYVPTFLSRPAWSLVAAAVLLFAAGLFVLASRNSQSKAVGEFADLHVMALASANPVDVVSSDRHTVKPWFQGKLPFSFDLPELNGSPFTLVGGRIAYFHQEPGAQLIFTFQRHLISVFIFRDTPQLGLPGSVSSNRSSAFTNESWTKEGLRYVIMGDAGAGTIQELTQILQRGQ